MFGEFGTVQSANLIEDRETGRSRGFGFVEMSSKEEATQQKPTQRPLYKKWWLWAIGGVVVGGATLGLILGLTPRSHQSINWVQ